MSKGPEHTFTGRETDVTGVRVTCTISVPAGCQWRDFREAAEIAQMTASRAMSAVMTSRERAAVGDSE